MKIIVLIITFCFTSFCSAQYIGPDDKLHLGAGVIISATTYTYVYTSTKNKKKAFWYSLGMSALAGVTKEFIDVSENELFDTKELVETTVGGLFASTTLDLFVGKKKKEKLKNVAIVN